MPAIKNSTPARITLAPAFEKEELLFIPIKRPS
jgi:hypothetical protein